MAGHKPVVQPIRVLCPEPGLMTWFVGYSYSLPQEEALNDEEVSGETDSRGTIGFATQACHGLDPASLPRQQHEGEERMPHKVDEEEPDLLSRYFGGGRTLRISREARSRRFSLA